MVYLTNLAFNIVSAVVKVFETIMNKVCSMSTFYIALEKSIGSTLARNLMFIP
jgi:hypothetical protein